MNKILARIAFLSTKQVGIIALVIGFVYWYSFFDDGSSLEPQINALRAQVQEQEARKVKTEQTLKERDHLQETLTNLTAKYENLSRLVPVEMNSSELNKQLDQLRKTSRINQVLRKPEDMKAGAILDEWPVTLKLVGTYNDIAQFVYQASTTEKVMIVKKFRIAPNSTPGANQNDTYDGKLMFDVTLSAYKLANPATAPKPGEAPAQ